MTEHRIGQGSITVECRSDGSSVASELMAHYPCRFHVTSSPNHEIEDIEEQDAFKLKKALTCYVLGYGGGLVSGDRINLTIYVKPQASLVITSQSTSKAFKAIAGRSSTFVETTARVSRGGLLFLVPQPLQCFGGSCVEQETHVVMEQVDESLPDTVSAHDGLDPSLLLVDWYTGGRRDQDGLWNFTSFKSTTTISYSSDEFQETNDATSDLVFRDATRLSGGEGLLRHMQNFNVVCMVVLIGPRVQAVAQKFMEKYSSRHSYDENTPKEEDIKFVSNDTSSLDHNKGEGLNKNRDGLLVSCGTFQMKTTNKTEEGVVVRLAASTLEKAATFLSKEIGTLGEQVEDDPFLEILTAKRGMDGTSSKRHELVKQQLTPTSLNLLKHSFGTKKKDGESCEDETQQKNLASTINPLLLYQLVDSCVPSGGFAHSNTLEAAHQLHLLNPQKSSWTASLIVHCWDVVLQTFSSVVPFVISSCKLFRCHYAASHSVDRNALLSKPSSEIIEAWESIDFNLDVTTTSHVANRASVSQGSGMLRAFGAAFPNIAPVTKVIKRKVLKDTSKCSGHSASCFGAACGLLGIDEETCVSMFLYTTARDMVNAAVRMNLVGPLEGGRITNELCMGIDALIKKEVGVLVELGHEEIIHETHVIAPLIEILSNAHDRLYTRLFNS